MLNWKASVWGVVGRWHVPMMKSSSPDPAVSQIPGSLEGFLNVQPQWLLSLQLNTVPSSSTSTCWAGNWFHQTALAFQLCQSASEGPGGFFWVTAGGMRSAAQGIPETECFLALIRRGAVKSALDFQTSSPPFPSLRSHTQGEKSCCPRYAFFFQFWAVLLFLCRTANLP